MSAIINFIAFIILGESLDVSHTGDYLGFSCSSSRSGSQKSCKIESCIGPQESGRSVLVANLLIFLSNINMYEENYLL